MYFRGPLDLYYARSTTHGASWSEVALSRLVPDPPCGGEEDTPAFEAELRDEAVFDPPMEPGDYSALLAVIESGKTFVYAIYGGTDRCEAPHQAGVIYMSRGEQQ